jgi:hypothetical protein
MNLKHKRAVLGRLYAIHATYHGALGGGLPQGVRRVLQVQRDADDAGRLGVDRALGRERDPAVGKKAQGRPGGRSATGRCRSR